MNLRITRYGKRLVSWTEVKRRHEIDGGEEGKPGDWWESVQLRAGNLWSCGSRESGTLRRDSTPVLLHILLFRFRFLFSVQ